MAFRGHIAPVGVNFFGTGQIHEYQIIRNATLTAPSWGAANATYSAAEFDVAASAISGGVVLDRGYVAAGGAGAGC